METGFCNFRNSLEEFSLRVTQQSCALLAVFSMAVGCARDLAQKRSSPSNTGEHHGDSQSVESPMQDSHRATVLALWSKTFADSDPASWDINTIDAAAHSAPDSSVVAKWFDQYVSARGALPQTLVPDIRKEILANEQLQMLSGLPEGIAELIKGIFVTDEKIAQSIKDALKEKINNAIRASASLELDAVAFRFDLFKPTALTAQPESTLSATTFNTEIAAARWNLIMARSQLWSGKASGVQLLATAQTLSEWKYLFGIDQTAPGQIPAGGLTVLADGTAPTHLGRFDPREKHTPARIISGTYGILYPDVDDTIRFVTDVKERWVRYANSITLAEQARVWRSAAQAFERLRPRARANCSPLFLLDTGMFPNDAHQLSLAFLPGLAELLDGPLINADAREIYSRVSTEDNQEQLPASLEELVLLADALSAWQLALRDIRDVGLSADVTSMLADAPTRLRSALQLITQIILTKHIAWNQDGGASFVTLSDSVQKTASPALALRATATLAYLSREILPSAYLQRTVAYLFSNLTSTVIRPLARGSQKADPETLLWLLGLLSEIKQQKELSASYPWAESLENIIVSALIVRGDP